MMSTWVFVVLLFLLLNIVYYVSPEEDVYEEYTDAKLLNSIENNRVHTQTFNDPLIVNSLKDEDDSSLVPITGNNLDIDLTDPFNDDIKIVGTADGFIHAVDSSNNKIWSTSTGGPMASHHNSGNLDYNVIPATDGSLLVQSSQGMRKTSVKARMLAESAPIMTQEGLLLTGQKTSRILGVDINSGRVLHDTMATDNLGRVNSLSTLQNNKPKSNKKVIQQPLWVGRTDYTLRAFDGATGIEEFNMTFSEIHPIMTDTIDGSNNIVTTNNIKNLSPEAQTVPPTRRNKAIAATSIHVSAKSSPPLLSTPEGDVFFTDQTGEIHHGIALGSPAVAAFSVSSQSNNGDKIRATDPNYEIRPLQISHRLATAIGKPVSETTGTDNNVVLVKSLNDGGLYAIEIPVDDVKDMIIAIDSANNMLSLPSPDESSETVSTENHVAILKSSQNSSIQKKNDNKVGNNNIPEGIYASDETETVELSWEKRFATPETVQVTPTTTPNSWISSILIALFIIVGGLIVVRRYAPKPVKVIVDANKEEKQVEVIDTAMNIVTANNTEIEKEVKEEVDKDGRKVLRIGSLTYFPSIVLGYGSHGTVVFRGALNGRPVAIKRMLSQFNRAADREISLLIRSDGHPNVVRYFLKEQQGEFVYLALQLAKMSLKDFVLQLQKCMSRNKGNNTHENIAALSEVPDAARMALLQIAKGLAHLHSQRIVHRDIKPHNILCALPDELLLADDFSTGTSSDMKSIDNLGDYILKISDMGLSKQLDKDEASFASMSMSMPTQVSSLSTFGSSSLSGNENKQGGHNVIANEGPVGTIGWQAPELMALRGSGMNNVSSDGVNNNEASDDADEEEDESDDNNGENIVPQKNSTELDGDSKLNGLKTKESSKLIRRKTQNVDIFSLGCVFHYVLVPGVHPYGQWYEREANIMQGKADLSRISHMPDAIDLLQRMLEKDPANRPSAMQVSNHPFFWFSQARLSFLIALSDKLEHEPLDSITTLSLEANAETIVTRSWDRKLHASLIEDVGKYRKYDYSSVRDLLRLIRNKKNHYHELPTSVKELIGSMPSGYVSYFESKFPKLLMRCVEISCKYLAIEKTLAVYCEPITSLFGGNNVVAAAAKSDDSSALVASNTVTQESSVDVSNTSKISSRVESTSAEVTVWHSSAISDSLNKGKGWWRESDVWVTYTCSHGSNSSLGVKSKGRPAHLTKSATDFKYRSRLCTHWEITGGTNCPMRKKGKCDFAHGPLELRIKETRRDKWGVYHQTLVDGTYDPLRYSGGEDVLGAARSIEKIRVIEGSVSQFEKSSASNIGGGGFKPLNSNPINPNKKANPAIMTDAKVSGAWASIIKNNTNEGFGI